MKCLIVDDEPIARRGLKRLVDANPKLELCAMAADASEAAAYMAANPVDLVFLDIQMPGLTGIEFARQIPHDTLVIFTTAYSEYAVESYQVDAVDYLLKPIDPERFERAVNKAADYHTLLLKEARDAEMAKSAAEFIIVKADRRYHRVMYADILYVEGLKDYVIIHLNDGRRLVTRMTIKAMEETLPPDMFLRVNKSNIVRISAVDSFDSNDVFIRDTEFSIGLAFRDNVLKKLLQ